MITIKTMKQIATSSAIASFRASDATYVSADYGRRLSAMGKTLSQEQRRQWLKQRWQAPRPSR